MLEDFTVAAEHDALVSLEQPYSSANRGVVARNPFHARGVREGPLCRALYGNLFARKGLCVSPYGREKSVGLPLDQIPSRSRV